MGRESSAAVLLLLAAVLVASFAGCSGNNEEPAAPEAAVDEPQVKQLSPGELRYIQAAEPFVEAIVHQKYEEACRLLSGYARARMTLNQFVAPPDALTLQRDEQTPFTNVTPTGFAELMKKVEDLYGVPQSSEPLTVFSTDPDVLGRRIREGPRVLESASAVGAIPDSIPLEIRRASIHGWIVTGLTPDQFRQAAVEMGVKPEDLQKDPSFRPSFNVKLVLVEEEGQLTVGYFEFLPASRWN